MKILKPQDGIDSIQLGAGAVGSAVLRAYAQSVAIYPAGIRDALRMLIADGDDVESKNFKNQLFIPGEEGMKKVFCLADRYGEHYGLDILAHDSYIQNVDELDRLFANNGRLKILISCVDNNRTRQLFHEYFEQQDTILYIDAGVEGVILRDSLKDVQNRKEQDKIISTSGFSGQVVVGYKENGIVFLPPLGELYPDVLTDTESVFPTQACAETVSQPQRLATNSFAAQCVVNVLNNLLHMGEIVQHTITFNARFSMSNVTYVSKEVESRYAAHKEAKNNKTAIEAV